MKQIQAKVARAAESPTAIDTVETRDGLASRLPRWHSFDGLRSRMAPRWAEPAVASAASAAPVTRPSPVRRTRPKKSAGAHSS